MLFYGDTSDLGPGEGVGVQLQAGGAAVDPAPAHQQPVLGGDGALATQCWVLFENPLRRLSFRIRYYKV